MGVGVGGSSNTHYTKQSPKGSCRAEWGGGMVGAQKKERMRVGVGGSSSTHLDHAVASTRARTHTHPHPHPPETTKPLCDPPHHTHTHTWLSISEWSAMRSTIARFCGLVA